MNYNYYELVTLQEQTNEKLDTMIEKQNAQNILLGGIFLALCVILLLSIIKC